ncbi:MAG: hypothetical protein ACPG7E_02995 [Marinirhabdus sp.]
MKHIIIPIFIFTGLLSCNPKAAYTPEKCSTLKTVPRTNKLQPSDTLPGFYPIGKGKVAFSDLDGGTVYVFFKKENGTGAPLLNGDITYKNIGTLAKSKSTDIIVLSDYKIAAIYGIEHTPKSLSNSFLFVADKNRAIRKIYKNVCEEDIIKMLNGTKTQ